MPQAREVVLAVGVDERRHLGQPLVGLVVVHHHHVHAETPGGGQRLEAGGAAVERQDQRGALPDQALDGADVGAIALGHAVGDVDARLETVRGEEQRHLRAGAGAVHVIVAENGDPLAAGDGIGQA